MKMRLIQAIVAAILLMSLPMSAAHADPDMDAVKHALSLADAGDAKGALGIIQPLAEGGNALAQSYLGKMYAAGIGVDKSPSLAVQWWQRAADQGLHEAQFTLGAAIAGGIGIAKDEVEGLKWFIIARTDKDGFGYSLLSKELGPRKTAIARDRAYRWMLKKALTSDDGTKVAMLTELSAEHMPQAQFQLGRLYALGLPGALTSTKKITVPGLLDLQPDPVAAADLYRKAALQGYAPAQTALAHSLGNNDEAIGWYREAAEQGNGEAQARLADMYASGTGMSRDPAKALELYHAAAIKRDVVAMRALADAYSPDGIAAVDLSEAYKWLVLAKSEAVDLPASVEEIDGRLSSLSSMMSTSKIDAAKDAAAACIAAEFKGCN